MTTPSPADRMAESSRHYRHGGVQFVAPEGMVSDNSRAIDSAAAEYRADGLRVIVDRGPFSDPLTGYTSSPEHKRWEETIGGRKATIVSFSSDRGRKVVAARFASNGGDAVTVVVTLESEMAVTQGLAILRSITFT